MFRILHAWLRTFGYSKSRWQCIGLGLALAVISWSVWTLYLRSEGGKHVSYRLQSIAGAPTLLEAQHHIDALHAYATKRRLTSGSTSYIWASKTNDVGLWYDRIQKLKETASKDAKGLSEEEHLLLLRALTLAPEDTQLPSSFSVWIPERMHFHPHGTFFFWALMVQILITLSAAVLVWDAKQIGVEETQESDAPTAIDPSGPPLP